MASQDVILSAAKDLLFFAASEEPGYQYYRFRRKNEPRGFQNIAQLPATCHSECYMGLRPTNLNENRV